MARHSFGFPPTVSLVLASAFWAIATVISKELLASVPPITLLVLQLVPSALVLWILVAVHGTPPLCWREMPRLALLGVLNPGLSYTLSMLGLKTTTAGVATLLWAAEPALIVVLAWLLLREAITIRLAVFTATAACGVVLVAGLLSSGDLAEGTAEGAILILGGVFCCALYTVWCRAIAPAVDPLLTVSLQQTTGLLWALAIWPLKLDGGGAGRLLSLTTPELLGAVVAGLMYYAAAFWLYLNGLRAVPASTAGMFINLTPVFGVATAYVFLGERLTQIQWFGAAIILTSVVALLTWSTSQSGRQTRE